MPIDLKTANSQSNANGPVDALAVIIVAVVGAGLLAAAVVVAALAAVLWALIAGVTWLCARLR